MARQLAGRPLIAFSPQTAIGALARHISQYDGGDFQPMNINFGLIDPLEQRVRGKRNRSAQVAQRALERIEQDRDTVMEDAAQ